MQRSATLSSFFCDSLRTSCATATVGASFGYWTSAMLASVAARARSPPFLRARIALRSADALAASWNAFSKWLAAPS